MTRLPKPIPVMAADRQRGLHAIPGRVYRGLALTPPYDFRGGQANPIPQSRVRTCWSVVHVLSGLSLGIVWGKLGQAWAVLVQVADAANWESSEGEVTVDQDCIRLHRELQVRAHDEMEVPA